MGVLGIVSGAWLWSSDHRGIILGSAVLVAGIVIAFAFIVAQYDIVSFEIGMTFVGVNGAMLCLAVLGWSNIKELEYIEGARSV